MTAFLGSLGTVAGVGFAILLAIRGFIGMFRPERSRFVDAAWRGRLPAAMIGAQ